MSKIQLPLSQDNNTLDQVFYHELLHIMGLIEVKEGGKKLIQRKKSSDRYSGSLLENAIAQLDSLDKISRLENPEYFGATYQDQLFNIGLDLVITWVNRILFIKLLEAQLINYNQGNKNYSILNLDKIKDFDDLNSLFFMVLARKNSDRSEKIQQIFAHVPYLNSSLFEPTELEHEMIFISNLQAENLPIFSVTVLKDHQGKKLTGTINILQYLFEFLNAYDFGETSKSPLLKGGLRGDKRLINASVLGLIFEKINGYQDGSFFTPGFITMYMCRETIRRAIIQKFNEVKGWPCQNLDDLYDKIDDKKEANTIINSLKICDPAVGSGHFLVSALNEIIAIKSELKILLDRNGKTLRDYQITVENDELVIIDDNGDLFQYNSKNTESQRIQETLFHEKQTIIENCLFGVDINPNSVKICRLRLWIELLKNAYYKQDTTKKPGFLEKPGFYPEMETLPNIDIKIKCGNSLISRFPLNQKPQKIIKNEQLYQNAFEWRYEFPQVLNDQGEFIGFDVIIGNPPYIRQEEFSAIKPILKKNFSIYNSIADLLTYFVELGYNLLRKNGVFQFIISNKFTRANYGQNMRSFLVSHTELTHFIDFSGLSVFDEATVDAAILGFIKHKVIDNQLVYANIDKNQFQLDSFTQDLIQIQQKFLQSNLTENSWSFEKTEVLQIKQKVESQGVPLKDWDISIFRGILTGYNEAFVIDGQKRQELIAEDPKSAEIIKPLLRGRDLQKYYPDYQDLWLINFHNGYTKDHQRIPALKIADYPAIKAHLDRFFPQLIKRKDQGQTPYNLRNCAYIENFEKTKIIYSNMTKFLPFVIDLDDHYYHNDKSFHLLSKQIFWLGSFLNSKLFKYCFSDNFPRLGVEGRELRKVFFDKIPVKQITEEEEKPFKELVTKILEMKKINPQTNTTELEREIDQLVYQLYGLTETEIKLVEGDHQ